MVGNKWLLFPVLFPMAAAMIFLFLKKEKQQQIYIFVSMLIEISSVIWICITNKASLQFWQIDKNINIMLQTDGISCFFACLISGIWLFASVFSLEYMKHEKNTKRFFCFFMMTLGALMGLSFSGNFMTMYLFYEMMTLLTLPLVIHSGTAQAMQAGYKYLGYSIFGAGLGLAGFFFLSQYCKETAFVPGGTLAMESAAGNETLLLIVFLLMMIGFGCKAGMWPLHGWLPTAHPVAPSPASAVLSGVITKAGVLAIIRVGYYLFGAEFIKGTWTQQVILCFCIFTIFMGSMLAYKEKLLKKRFAYSTVSQVCYVLFGLMLFSPVGFCGALLQIVFHAISKNILFFTAGAVIYKTGKEAVSQLKGIGKEMPIVMLCFTMAALSLIGIPPAGGFISKWFLAEGALAGELFLLGLIGTVVLMVSALLTAGYLLPIVSKGFFTKQSEFEKKEPCFLMTTSLSVLSILVMVLGMFPGGLLDSITKISNTLFAFV